MSSFLDEEIPNPTVGQQFRRVLVEDFYTDWLRVYVSLRWTGQRLAWDRKHHPERVRTDELRLFEAAEDLLAIEEEWGSLVDPPIFEEHLDDGLYAAARQFVQFTDDESAFALLEAADRLPPPGVIDHDDQRDDPEDEEE